MRHKKVKLCVLLFLGLGLTGLQAQTMYVRQANGAKTAYTLGNIKKMSFSSGNITVSKTDGNHDVYPLSGLRYLNFTDLTTSNIQLAEKTKSTILLYPNPVVDQLNILLQTTENQAGVIEILSIEGKVVCKELINSQTNVFQVNVSALPKGLYLCKINNGTTLETTKFLKQ